MPTIITPVSVVLPATFNAPVDGEPRVAASVNDAFQKLGDGILYATTKAAADTAVLQAEHDGLAGVETLPDFKKVEIEGTFFDTFHNKVLGIHYAIGTTGVFYESSDAGQTWTANTIVGYNLFEGAASDDGVTMVATSTENVAVLTDAIAMLPPTIVDARAGAAGTIISVTSVSYDPQSNLFVWFARSSTPSFILSTSPGDDGLTWTLRSVAVFGSFTAKTIHKIATDGSGRSVLALGGGTDSQIFYSDDGGATWTNAGALPHGLTVNTLSLAVTPTGDFLLAVSAAAGEAAEVWKSTDGVAWTKKSTLIGTSIKHLAAHRTGWVAAAYYTAVSKYAIVVSDDEGTSWRRLPGYYASVNGVQRTDGRIVIASTDVIYTSQYLSTPDVTATT